MLAKLRETIKRLFLENGFTIKADQTDLKPYVYCAAEQLAVKVLVDYHNCVIADAPAINDEAIGNMLLKLNETLTMEQIGLVNNIFIKSLHAQRDHLFKYIASLDDAAASDVSKKD